MEPFSRDRRPAGRRFIQAVRKRRTHGPGESGLINLRRSGRAGRLPLANENDSAIVSAMCQQPTEHILPFLMMFSGRIMDDACYWQGVGVGWVKAGEHANLEHWCRLFASQRRGRWKIMKSRDRQLWRKLPNSVLAYRAFAPGEDVDRALSWSLDSKVCSKIWPDRQVTERRIPKERIEALFTRRGEAELLVRPAKGWAGGEALG